jgi:hypothetical protein
VTADSQSNSGAWIQQQSFSLSLSGSRFSSLSLSISQCPSCRGFLPSLLPNACSRCLPVASLVVVSFDRKEVEKRTESVFASDAVCDRLEAQSNGIEK